MSEMTITISSDLHGNRTFRRVGTVMAQRKPITLAVWETECVVCGAPFEIKTGAHTSGPGQTNAFTTITCPTHRLTHDERLQLLHAKRAERQAVFDAIKAQKLAAVIGSIDA